jgi:hypothetical protein
MIVIATVASATGAMMNLGMNIVSAAFVHITTKVKSSL